MLTFHFTCLKQVSFYLYLPRKRKKPLLIFNWISSSLFICVHASLAAPQLFSGKEEQHRLWGLLQVFISSFKFLSSCNIPYMNGATHILLCMLETAPFLSVTIAHQLLQTLVFVYIPHSTISTKISGHKSICVPVCLKQKLSKTSSSLLLACLQIFWHKMALAFNWAALFFYQIFLKVISVEISPCKLHSLHVLFYHPVKFCQSSFQLLCC